MIHAGTPKHTAPITQKKKTPELLTTPKTPPPVSYTPDSPTLEQSMLSAQSSDGGNTPTLSKPTIDTPPTKAVNGIERRLSSTSDDFQLVFGRDIDGMSRASSTKSDVRDRCRGLIAKSLMKGFSASKQISNLVCLFSVIMETAR